MPHLLSFIILLITICISCSTSAKYSTEETAIDQNRQTKSLDDSKTITPCKHFQHSNVRSQEAGENSKCQYHVSLPDLESSKKSTTTEPEIDSINTPTFEYLMPTPSSQSSIQEFPPTSLEAMGLQMGNYRGILYPYMHPQVYATYYRSYPVRSLPPVSSTYIHGLYSSEDTFPKLHHGMDVLDSQNTLYLPLLERRARKLRNTKENEFLHQLEHDAIMKNILPTMPFPFGRYATPPVQKETVPVFALVPKVPLDIAHPILFSCSPKVETGYISQAKQISYREVESAANKSETTETNKNKPGYNS